MTLFITQPSRGLHGVLRVSSDKSISHRALIFAALAEGKTRIRNLLFSEDVLRTLTILNQLGVKTSHTATTMTAADELIIEGVGVGGLRESKEILYCGNSGTTLRLMLGLLSAQPFVSRLTGDASLNQRPMERAIDPLTKMGARFSVEKTNKGRVIVVNPKSKPLRGITHTLPVASAQIKTALILAGLYAQGDTTIAEPLPTRNHTEIMLRGMGVPIQITENQIIVRGPCQKSLLPPNGGHLDIPADISSAAFFIVAALIVPNSELTLTSVNLNPTRTGILDVLAQMGAQITITNQRTEAGEVVGELTVRSSQLKGVSICGALIPRLIDEIPILALAAACAEGQTIVSGAGELRVKETDRIRAICSELKKLGLVVEEKGDGFVLNVPTCRRVDVLTLNQSRFTFNATGLTSYGDHRMAMTEAVAGLVLDQPAVIDDVDCVRTSFPNFFDLLQKLSGSREGQSRPAPNP